MEEEEEKPSHSLAPRDSTRRHFAEGEGGGGGGDGSEGGDRALGRRSAVSDQAGGGEGGRVPPPPFSLSPRLPTAVPSGGMASGEEEARGREGKMAAAAVGRAPGEGREAPLPALSPSPCPLPASRGRESPPGTRARRRCHSAGGAASPGHPFPRCLEPRSRRARRPASGTSRLKGALSTLSRAP